MNTDAVGDDLLNYLPARYFAAEGQSKPLSGEEL
jgi:hypothetical protein